jgi:hypothetical protein
MIATTIISSISVSLSGRASSLGSPVGNGKKVSKHMGQAKKSRCSTEFAAVVLGAQRGDVSAGDRMCQAHPRPPAGRAEAEGDDQVAGERLVPRTEGQVFTFATLMSEFDVKEFERFPPDPG